MSRGLARMSPEARRAIARRGAAAMRARNKAHVYTPEEAKAARAKQLEQTRTDAESHDGVAQREEAGHHNG